MNNKTIVTIATISVIILATISVGFAYAAYTSNTNNNTDLEYLIVVPSDGTSQPAYSSTFNGSVTFDTVTILDQGVQKVQYQLSDYNTISGHKYASLGEIYLAVNETKSDKDYKVSIIVDDGTGLNTTDYSYYALMEIGSGETEAEAREAAEEAEGSLIQLSLNSGDMIATSGTIENEEDNAYSVVLLTAYVALSSGDTCTKPLANPLDSTVLDNVTFLFKAETL